MKRFKFGLEKVLKLRSYREQETKNELGRAIGVLNNIENNIKQNSQKHEDAVRERFTGLNSGLNGVPASSGIPASFGILAMQDWDNYILRLEGEAELLAEEKDKAEAVVEEKRNLYLEASRELKVMENLKEKRRSEYRKEMLAAETRERDDTWRAKR